MAVSPVTAQAREFHRPMCVSALKPRHYRVLSSSGNLGPHEFVSGATVPGKTYRYHVTGFVNGPTQVNIQSKQYFPAGMAPSGSTSGSSSLPTLQGVTPLKTVQLT